MEPAAACLRDDQWDLRLETEPSVPTDASDLADPALLTIILLRCSKRHVVFSNLSSNSISLSLLERPELMLSPLVTFSCDSIVDTIVSTC